MESKRPAKPRGGNMIRPVSEAGQIQITERLRMFREGGLPELTFEAGLSNHERAIVHNFCRKMGFTSKSHGSGNERRVTVYKSGAREAKKGAAPAPATPILFSNETQQALLEVFSKFPPTEDEGSSGLDHSAVCSVTPKPPEENVQCLKMTPVEIQTQLKLYTSRKETTPALQQMEQVRKKLPIASHRDSITSAIDRNQVVIIAGETGCGKSTQVPQFLLDHMWTQSKPCRIICTQPRRISAISVADRVASERGEAIGKTVGYQIRLESKGGPHSSLMFCTNGVLLRKLVGSDVQATHIIVDEIHERDCNADFLLIVLRDLLLVNKNLRVVLMSATLNSEVFSAYFNNCPVLRIPGFTHPVTVHHLEDVLALSKSGTGNSVEEHAKEFDPVLEEDREEIDAALLQGSDDDFDYLMGIMTVNPTPEFLNFQQSETGVTALMAAASRGRLEDVSSLLSLGANCELTSRNGNTALQWAESKHHSEVAKLLRDHIQQAKSSKEAELLGKYQQDVDVETLDFALMERLLRIISAQPDAGAVLIFLPGWEDITSFRNRLMASRVFGDKNKYEILPLHSMIPMKDQKKVFVRPRLGVRKIVLATNIAETSITIDDIVYVIDTGRVKEKSYDPYNNVSTLQTAWISKANARQRQGRAGRCRPGVCYHLYSKFRAASLAEFQIPEMNRTPLEEVCLKVKLMQPSGSIREFLTKALDPPLDITIRNAISLLQDIGALTGKEELTQLGKELGSLPVHPSTSKMLLLGILLNCLDPALTIACAAGYREPYVLPLSAAERREAAAAKSRFVASYGGYSDHLATVAAFEAWQEAKRRGQDARFCSQNYINGGVMFMLEGMRKQLLRELVARGFVGEETQNCSLNAQDPGIVRALVAACLYPLVGKVLPPLSNFQKGVVQTARGEKIRIQPSSATSRLTSEHGAEVLEKHLLVFDEITRGESRAYVRNSTLIKPHPLLFLCTELSVAPLELEPSSDEEEEEAGDEVEKNMPLMEAPDASIALVIDRWLKYQTTSVEAAQIYCLRERLLAALFFKVKHPRENLPEMLGASVYALACILSYEGSLEVDRSGLSSRGVSIREQEQLLRKNFTSLDVRRQRPRLWSEQQQQSASSRVWSSNEQQQQQKGSSRSGAAFFSSSSRQQQSFSSRDGGSSRNTFTKEDGQSSVQVRQNKRTWVAGSSSSSSKQEWRAVE